MQFSCFNSLQKNAHLQKCYCNEKVIFSSGKKIQLAIFSQTKMRMLIQLRIRYWHSRISSTQFYLYKVNFSGLCKITVIWLQFAIACQSTSGDASWQITTQSEKYALTKTEFVWLVNALNSHFQSWKNLALTDISQIIVFDIPKTENSTHPINI